MKQKIFYFYKRDAINVYNISKDDIDWCLEMLAYGRDRGINKTQDTIIKMFKSYFPEYLL